LVHSEAIPVKVRCGARLSCICRKHDEHNGFDVLGSDICMCRPYLRHGIEVCARKKTDSVSDAARNCQS
jgi:GTP cyclohydrolase II